MITPTDMTACDCGGHSYIGVFDKYLNRASFQPSWTYRGADSTDSKLIAETVSHEVGHSLGLLHDGFTSDDYRHVPRTTPWRPPTGPWQRRPHTARTSISG